MVDGLAFLVAGLFAWTFLEYLIHGWLSHTFNTFATKLHSAHHRDAHNVFTVRAWMPVALVWALVVSLFPFSRGSILLSGVVVGFAGYETIHYRIHFRRPRWRLESYLRGRHLVHHEHYPGQCFGVTSAIWDLAFGTEPTGTMMNELCESAAATPPLTGTTNLYKLKYFIWPFR